MCRDEIAKFWLSEICYQVKHWNRQRFKRRQLKITTGTWRRAILFLPWRLLLKPFLNSTMHFLQILTHKRKKAFRLLHLCYKSGGIFFLLEKQEKKWTGSHISSILPFMWNKLFHWKLTNRHKHYFEKKNLEIQVQKMLRSDTPSRI